MAEPRLVLPGHRKAWLAAALGALGGIALLRAVWPLADRYAETTGRGAHGTPPSPSAVTAGFETKDAEPRYIVYIIIGGAILVTGVILGLRMLQASFDSARLHDAPPLTAQEVYRPAPPEPNLQPTPLQDIAALRLRETRLLSHYAWADAARTHARIPIGRAMTLTVGKTLDDVP